MLGFHPLNQFLTLNGQELKNEKTFNFYNIKQNCELSIYLIRSLPPENRMKIEIKDCFDKCYSLDVVSNDSIRTIKLLLSFLSGL
jgi:hypothetical protein